MPLSIGIVGLPNVGKSTLFQTITQKQVDIANYPFCTIDPNVGVVAVPDERVDKLAELTKSAKKIYTTIEFYDIAGLVKGAHKGEGLGNKFLANIRETDAIVYVLRAFLNPDIINTLGEVNPLEEKEILETELIFKDLETLQNGVMAPKKAKEYLEKGKILFGEDFDEEEKKILSQHQLLTLKPRLYLLNVKDEQVKKETIEEFEKNKWPYLIVDLATELEAADLSKEERKTLGLPEVSELDILIKKAYEILGLITFFTATGADEVRAWAIERGATAPKAGGKVHSDFEANFIKAEVINWKDLVDSGGFAKAREKGLIRTEGREYVVQDGDVIQIKHSA